MKNKLTTHYNELYSDKGHAFGGGEPTSIVRDILKYKTTGTVLDAGAGEGRNTLFLAEKGFDVEAVDLSKVGLDKLSKLAKERGLKIKTKVADLNEIDWPVSYDVIVSSFILHHLEIKDAEKFFAQMKEHTNNGGLNVIALFTKDGDFFRDDPETRQYYPEKGEVKGLYEGWEILKYGEEKSRTRKTKLDGSPMFNISSLLIAQKQ